MSEVILAACHDFLFFFVFPFGALVAFVGLLGFIADIWGGIAE